MVSDRLKPLRLSINFAVGGAELEEYQEAYSDDEGQQATQKGVGKALYNS